MRECDKSKNTCKQQLPIVYMSFNNVGHLISSTITTLQQSTITTLQLSILSIFRVKFGIENTINGNVDPITGHEGSEGELIYSTTLSLTSVLDGSGWSTPRPSRFTPGKTRNQLYRKLGGPQGRSGRVRKISPPPAFDPRTVQPVASRYTDWAISAHRRYTIPLLNY